MDEEDLERLRAALSGLEGALTLRLHRAPEESPFEEALAAAARAVAGACGAAITLEEEGKEGDGGGLPGLPALSLEPTPGDRRVTYLALPRGPEATPFVEAVSSLAQGASDQGVAAALEGLDRPAELLVLVSPACPHCPGAVREAVAVAAASPAVRTLVVDAERFPEVANRHGARAVPFSVLDAELTMVGVVPRSELVAAIAGRDGSGHAARLLRGHVETARFGEAARLLLDAETGGASAFVDAWGGSTMTERIALLLVAEEALAARRDGLDVLVPALVPLLAAEDGALRGDTADLLGRIGNAEARPHLEALRGDPIADVAEVAAEAIEGIEERGEG